MDDGILIGIDAGTSVLKSIAFSTTGEQLAVAAIANSYETLSNGGVEQDMARTWADAATTLRQLCDQIPNLASRLIAISVTGQGDGTWLVDKNGEPVAPAFLWLDARAAAIAEKFAASPKHHDHYQRTGTGVNACQMSTHLAWLNQFEPHKLEKATSAFHCKDWLYFKLTGDRATDPSEACFTFGNFRSKTYSTEILDALDAPHTKRLLPNIIDGVTSAGKLSDTAAKAIGLKSGTPVVLGYVDVVCTALGAGLYDASGKVGCSIFGSTGMHMRMATTVEQVKLNANMSGYTMAFPAPGMNAQMQSNMASTLNIDWWLDVALDVLKMQGVDRTRSDLLKTLDDHVLKKAASRVIYHPYISRAGERGPFMDPNARAMFTGLELGTGYGDMMRGVFEGLCFASRDCFSAMGDIPHEVRITGGAARSKALRLILASVLNANIRTVTRAEAGAAGAAMIAAMQQKLFPNIDACANIWVNPLLGENTVPDAPLVKNYDRNFAVYKSTREAMPANWRALQNAKH
jgi:erythritol kinase (D-erythritol 1-phosphate-forming)